MRDYVPLEKQYYGDLIQEFMFNFYNSICFVGKNNKELYYRYYRVKPAEELTIGQQFKLGVTIVHKYLQKSYSKRKIRKTIKLRYVKVRDAITVRICPSSKLFAKLIKVINKYLTDEQKSGLSKGQFTLLENASRIEEVYLLIAPIHSDTIITCDGLFTDKYKYIGECLAKSIRVNSI